MPLPSPYDGKRIKHATLDNIYMVLDGTLRHIPSWEAYTRLYADNDWETWTSDQLGQLPLGRPLNDDVELRAHVRTPGERIYLWVDGTCRWIVDESVMEKFHFVYDRVKWNTMPDAHPNSTNTGSDITAH